MSPKVTMTFELPEEQDAMLLAQRGSDYYYTILEVQRIIRDVRKYDKPMEEAFTEIEREVNEAKTEDIS